MQQVKLIKKPKEASIGLRIPLDLRNKLVTKANKEGKTLSQVINEILEKEMGR